MQRALDADTLTRPRDLIVQKPRESGYMVATRTKSQKAKSPYKRAKCLIHMGWLMGLEPTTTGITILDSTN